ncbi:MAG: sulfotransferase [Thermoleophilia bacterium]|nr:sulfotransferase [Thermoleophilia bacterium]
MNSTTRSYLICGTPRSGTFLLAGLLASTGIAGRPEEYFWREDEPRWRERWGVTSDADYVAHAIAQGTTPNGVFGAKVMWGYFGDVLAKLRRLRDEPSDLRLLEAFFPNLRFLWLRREDAVAQAVSWSKAMRTGVWYAEQHGAPAGDPSFDFDEIAALAAEAETHGDAWRRWFDRHGVEPFAVTYEELEAAKVAVTRRALAFLGLPGDGVPIEERTARQRDALNAEWVRRFRETARRRG